jgi:hypothetical protein
LNLLRLGVECSIYSFSVYLQQSPEALQPRPEKLQLIKSAFLDCFSSSTGHGLAQMVRPGNLFLKVLWAVFFIVALVGGCVFIYLAVDQFFQFGVITTTKIKREANMTFPTITFCSGGADTILECFYINGEYYSADLIKLGKVKNVTLHDNGFQVNCVQLNYGKNKTELDTAKVEGYGHYGYNIRLYIPPDNFVKFAVTDNSARVVYEEVREEVFPGQISYIALSKTVQITLGTPFSKCNETKDYRHVACREDCFRKKMNEICGCEFRKGCGSYWNWTEECKNARYYRSEIESNCNLQCPSECNQVSFQTNSVGREGRFSQSYLNKYKPIISAHKFDTTNMTDDEIKQRITELVFYFNKFETTEITQSPSMTPTNLIGNVGGVLGKIKLFIHFFF